MKPGTIVMLISTPVRDGYPTEPRAGAIGEVIDATGKTEWQVEAGCSAVHFPRNVSPHVTGYWQYKNKRLVPIAGPDVDMTTDEPVRQDKYVEDLV